MFWKVQVLKQDISTYRLRALAPLISGTVGVEYMRKAFSTRYQLAALPSIAEASQLLPRTVAWFKEGVQNLEQEKAELEVSLASVQGTIRVRQESLLLRAYHHPRPCAQVDALVSTQALQLLYL